MKSKPKIKVFDSKIINYQQLVVMELFKVDTTSWVRAEDKRGDSKYFTEHEWLQLKSTNR